MPEGDGRSGPLNVDALKKTGAKASATNAKTSRKHAKREVQPALMTIDEAATRLALSPSMVRKMIGGGQLTAVRIGRSVRLRIDDVEAIVVARTP
jgi:excisionase family DNA binding protein